MAWAGTIEQRLAMRVRMTQRPKAPSGTTSQFATMTVAARKVTNEAREGHLGPEFLAFLRLLGQTYPKGQGTSSSTTATPSRCPTLDTPDA
jgi:hypothetical protein